MSSIEELKISIKQYELQLSQVSDAMKSCENEGERASMENLKCDLQELLDLTQESLREQIQPKLEDGNEDDGNNDDGDEANVNDAITDDDDDDGAAYGENGSGVNGRDMSESSDPFAKEMALFMSELNACQTTPDSSENDRSISSQLEKFEKVRAELAELVGKKCSAPYTFAWGARDYNNALVCGIDTDSDVLDLEHIRVKVLFTNPIHRNMIPCPFYLDGDCRFDSDKCRFSHGECVQYTDLKEYKQPNFSLLSHVKHPVLAKQSDKIWYKGRVVTSNFNDKTCQIRLEHNKQEVTCEFAELLPIEEDKPFEASSDSEEDASDDDNDCRQMHQANLIQQSLLTPSPDQAMGEWEKHTKGFGSRILQKLGYVVGTGLGQHGEGIIVPISAQILPPGKSLDHCMELREQANGDKDLFSVERKLKRLKKKADAMAAKAYEREKQSTDVFSFMNETVFTNMPTTSKAVEAKPKHHDYKNHTNKSLNVEHFKIGEDIRRKEREIEKLKESLQRHKEGTPVAQQLSTQLNARKTELQTLRRTENHLKKEQGLRKDKSKLAVF